MLVLTSVYAPQVVRSQTNRVADDSWGASTFGVRYAVRLRTNIAKPGGDVLFYTQVTNSSSRSIVLTIPANDHYYLTNNSGKNYELTRIISVKQATGRGLQSTISPGGLWTFPYKADLIIGLDVQPGEYELTATRDITVAGNTVCKLVSNKVKLKVVDGDDKTPISDESANTNPATTNNTNTQPRMGF